MAAPYQAEVSKVKIPTVFVDEHGRKWHARKVVVSAELGHAVTAECSLITWDDVVLEGRNDS